MNQPNLTDKKRLRAHFGFTRIPFNKKVWAQKMFDSASQRELIGGLSMWLEIQGIALVTGPSGVGKSITLRRFARELDETRYRVIDFSSMPTTATGFLRALNRKLELPMRLHGVDLFDQARDRLVELGTNEGPHPVLIVDDAEGLRIHVIDILRRLTAANLDSDNHFSLLLAGTDDLLHTLKAPSLAPLRSRISYAWQLRPYGLEDTRNYIRFHLQRADIDPKTVSELAAKRIFQAAHGMPRYINQLATQALIQAAVIGRDAIDGDFMAGVINGHPLYAA